MTDDNRTPGSDIWISMVIILRVIVMLVLWIILYLAIFLGYFTFPVLLIGLVSLVYMITDMILVFVLKRRQARRRGREEFLKARSDNQQKGQ